MTNSLPHPRFIVILVGTLLLSLACHRDDHRPSEIQNLSPVTGNPSLRITRDGIGLVRLGMTLDQARKALPNAKFERSSDGEGAALVDVKIGDVEVFTLHADEDNPDSPIDWSKQIGLIETFSGTCSTLEGVHPGMLIQDVEKIYGKVTKIFRSDIEQREFVDFSHEPKHFVFRIDYTGIYEEGQNQSTKYQPGAKIHSIAIFSGSE